MICWSNILLLPAILVFVLLENNLVFHSSVIAELQSKLYRQTETQERAIAVLERFEAEVASKCKPFVVMM
jgi:hypothetical protein